MKNVLTLLVWGILVISCTDSKTNGTTISVLEDVTENNFIARPTYKRLAPKLGLDADKWTSARFRYSTITGINYNQKQELSIEKQVPLLGNELQRKKKVHDFLKKVQSILEKPKDSSSRRYSSIWEPLIKELVTLQKDSTKNTILYLFSDLQENNALWFSVYRKSDLKRLKMEHEWVISLFLERAIGLTKTNKHIRIVVVYQPANSGETIPLIPE